MKVNYLNNYQAMLDELLELDLEKSVRIDARYATSQGELPATDATLHVTHWDKDENVIREVTIQKGRAVNWDDKDMNELADRTDEAISKLEELFKRNGFTIRKGQWEEG